MSTLPPSGLLPESHLVPDVLVPGLRLVFCGTALGRRSAEQRAYYAHPGNLFWRTLHETGLTPKRIDPQDYRLLLDVGIGLTDLAKRHFGNDDALPGDAFDRAALRAKITQFRPALLAFTSKKSASGFLGLGTGKLPYGLQRETVDATRLFVLPSPSGAARGHWDRSYWADLADLVRALPQDEGLGA